MLILQLCDGIGVARLLNATMVLPKFEVAAYWNESRYEPNKVLRVVIIVVKFRFKGSTYWPLAINELFCQWLCRCFRC